MAMASQSDRKIAEGLEHTRLAEKCMKTSFFKWKPDVDGAISEYQKAAVAFKNAKASEQCTSTYIKMSALQKENGSAFHAAKSLESAALIYKDMQEFTKAADLVEQASDLYLEHGTPDTAAIALDRAAKMIEGACPDRAIILYQKAYNVSEGEDNSRQMGEMIGKAARILCKQRRLDDAAIALKQEIDCYVNIQNEGLINKLMMGLVMVHLHRDDYIAADQAFQLALRDYPGFHESEEARPIEQLLEAYYEGDQEAAETIVKSPLFRFMDNEFTKLARDLRVPGGKKTKSPAPTAAVGDLMPEGEATAAAGEDEEDEYAGGLC